MEGCTVSHAGNVTIQRLSEMMDTGGQTGERLVKMGPEVANNAEYGYG